MNFRSRVLSLWQFIKILRIEPFMFLLVFQVGLKMTPDSQIIQDKICTQWYNTTSSYCQDLPSTKEPDNEQGHYKSRVLSDAAQFNAYNTYIATAPGIIWALFIGAWMDRYATARKWVLITFSVTSIIEDLYAVYLTISWGTSVYYNLGIPVLGLLLVGGGSGPRIAVMHYMTTTTAPDMMAIRFMLFQLCLTLGIPAGSALGGYILVQEPAFGSGQIRNYTLVYIIALVFEVLALLLIIFLINENVAQKQQKEIEDKLNDIREKTGNDEGQLININSNNNNNEMNKNKSPIKLLFDFENIKSMIRTLIKRRPNKARPQLLWLILSLGIVMGEQIGMMVLNSQFIQKVYAWDPDWTSYMGSISMVVGAIGTMLIIPIASKLLKVGDIPLALFGYLLIIATDIIKASWLDSGAHYLGMAMSFFSGTAQVCSKSHLAKIVDRDEMGKVMSFLTTLETIAPMVFVTILTQIFKQTIDTYPGTIYFVLAGFLLIPILTTVWIYFCTERPVDEKLIDHADIENQIESEQDTIQDKI